jgi:tetratricopeptide (TPR) repeat protein
MKKHILTLCLGCLMIASSHALNEAYKMAMQRELQTLDQAQSPEELQKVANAFARIAQMMPEEWIPEYYAGLALANAGFRSQGSLEEKDSYFAKAKKHTNLAVKISPENSEIVALQGYIILGELAADPNSRGQHLSEQAMQTFNKAISLNTQNPRAVIMLAQLELGMAQFFGQGPEKACGLMQSSLKMFEKEENTQPEEPFAPKWGKAFAEQMKGMCP